VKVRATLACALAALTSACATPGAGEKGQLVPIDLPAPSAGSPAPRRVALVVGVQRFDDARWRPLRFAEADARDMAEVLRDPAHGAFDEVRVLTGGPTRLEVLAAMRDLGALSRDSRDTVVVYVSSHGTLARDGTGRLGRYLVMRDTRLDDVPRTGLSLGDLESAFDALRSRRKVLVLAACHSGDGKSLLPEDVAAELSSLKAGFFPPPIDEVSRARVVLAASDFGETAREDEKLGHDVYTHFLLEALRMGLDRNGDGAVTAAEAHDHARRATYAFTGGRQRPSAESSEVGADAVVLAGRIERTGRPELYSYAQRLDGFTVRVDGTDVGDLPGGVALASGPHRVQLTKGGGPEILDARVTLGPGERVDLAHLMDRSDRWEIAPRLAALGFLDAKSRLDVAGGPAIGPALAVVLREWPAPGLVLRVDVAAAAGRATLHQGEQEAPFDYSVLTGGAAVAWRWAPAALGGTAFLVGPRLSAVWLERRFDLALAPPSQTYLTFAPGLLAGVTVPLGRRLTLGAELQADWAVVRVDGQDRSTGFGALLLGAGWRL